MTATIRPGLDILTSTPERPDQPQYIQPIQPKQFDLVCSRSFDENKPQSGTGSTSLVFRLKEHEPHAWSDLVELYSPLIFHWCQVCNLNSADAADVMQDVFEVVNRKIHLYETQDGGSFRGWLWRITQNKIKDFLRRGKGKAIAAGGTAAQDRLANLEDVNEPLSCDNAPTEEIESQRLLHRALQQIKSEFSERSWAAFWRTVVDELPTDLVAEELGISASGIRQAKRRVLRRLRLQLGGVADV